MTTYDTVTGEYINSSTVSLPTGSDGDSLIFVYYGNGNPSTFSGWSLNVTQVVNGSARFRVYSKTRAGGETTVTLPLVSGSGGYQYSILNVPSTFAYVDSAAVDLSTSTWSLTDSYNRVAPRFALGVLNCGDTGLSVSGDFTQDSTYNDSGDDRSGYAYVADVTSGPMAVTASGVWDAAGLSAWLVVFFSDEVVAVDRKWWVGLVGWGSPGGSG